MCREQEVECGNDGTEDRKQSGLMGDSKNKNGLIDGGMGRRGKAICLRKVQRQEMFVFSSVCWGGGGVEKERDRERLRL